MKTGIKMKAIFAIFLLTIAGACGNSPSVPANSGPDELDLAIRDASDYLNDNIPKGSMIVILNVQSDSAALSEYVIDELIANAVNDKIFKVVDRQQLDLIRTEQNFQLSGEVDDNLAISIGKFFGAQAIISGKINLLGDRYRMTFRGLDVQTAQVLGQYNRNIAAGKTINDLMRNGGGSGKVTQSTTGSTTGSGSTGTSNRATPTVTGVAVSPTTVSVDKGKTQQFIATITGTNNPDLSVTWTVTNNTSNKTSIGEDGVLTVGDDESITPLTVTVTSKTDTSKRASATVAVPGGIEAMNINNVATWNAAINRIRNGGNNQTYIINVTGTVSVPSSPENENLFGSVTGLTVTFQGGGTLALSARGNLIRIGAGQTVVARNITLRGHSDNNVAAVAISAAGTFRMEEGATVTGNSNNGSDSSMSNNSGGVYVNGGSFTMSGGSISGNRSKSVGACGGVYVGGTFTMSGGSISGNTGDRSGGVHVGGTFTMSGGSISANACDSNGSGGVYVNGTFTMNDGTISDNTTRSNGGGVYVNGTFTIRGGTIFGNTANFYGGGVYVANTEGTTFNKTGGTISGSDSAQSPGNTARQGHAVYLYSGGSNGRWRNATAGPDDNTDGYGFWLND